MMIKVVDGAPQAYSVGKLRKDNPNTSFPKNVPEAVLNEYGVYTVVNPARPDYDEATQKANQSTVELIDGVWTRPWQVIDKTAEELDFESEKAGKAVRTKRDTLLADTDWMALSDVVMSAEMATYRQSLRDITEHANFPNLVEDDWPVKPV